jgi:predicted RNA-binding Zn ribbon-like protein
MDKNSQAAHSVANRLCLDFANLPFSPGDPAAHPVSWLELVEFLVQKRIVSAERGEQLIGLAESDPQTANNLLQLSERLGSAIRFAGRALARNSRIHREWVDPINDILRITEGHDELEWADEHWRMVFQATDEGMDWLLAAVARSGAELIAEGSSAGVRRCNNPDCELLFCDDSRTRRRRWCSMAVCGNRSKVAAFARRRNVEKARAHHA